MNQKPLNLTIRDFTETRLNSYHAHWPVDPDTTRRLDRVRQSDPYAQSRDRYSVVKLVLRGFLFFVVAALVLISLIVIAEAVRN